VSTLFYLRLNADITSFATVVVMLTFVQVVLGVAQVAGSFQ